LQRILPDADASDRHNRSFQAPLALVLVADHIAVRGLVGSQRAKIDIGPDVGFDDPDEAGRHVLGVLDVHLPQVVVQGIFAGREYGKLRAALAAVAQERLGIEHRKANVLRERIGERLARPKGRTVLGGEHADLAIGNLGLGLGCIHVVEHIQQQRDLKPRAENARLRAVLAIDRHDLTARERSASIDAEELRKFSIADMGVRSREDAEEDEERS